MLNQFLLFPAHKITVTTPCTIGVWFFFADTHSGHGQSPCSWPAFYPTPVFPPLGDVNPTVQSAFRTSNLTTLLKSLVAIGSSESSIKLCSDVRPCAVTGVTGVDGTGIAGS